MKNISRLIGLTALAAITAITMAACPEEESPNTDPKTLIINQISKEVNIDTTTYAEVTIFPAGTSIDNVLDKIGITAWGEYHISESTYKSNSLTIPLFIYVKKEPIKDESGNTIGYTEPKERWTGYGDYDVYLEFTSETYTLHKGATSFSSDTVTMSMRDFNYPRIEKTLIIENITEEKIPSNSSFILIAISTVDASSSEVANLTKVVAAAGGNSKKGLTITGSGDNRTITARLYVVVGKAIDNDRWAASGTYDAWVASTADGKNQGFKLEQNITFSSRSPIVINAANFKPEPDDDP